MDSARITGNLTKHRQAGHLKRVTVKDPLSRIYAQRLIKEPAPISPQAVTRPRPPKAWKGQGATVKAGEEDGNARMGSKLVGSEVTEGQVVDAFVDDVLNSIGAVVRGGGGGGGGGGRGGGSEAGGREGKGNERRRDKGAAASALAATRPGPGVEEGSGKKGRVVMNHSTHIPGLLDVLNRLVAMDGISTIVPGALSTKSSNSNKLVLRIQAPTDQGFRLVARKGSMLQEVFVVSDLEAETLEAAIAWCM